ncbi:NAD(P)H-binding protein [Halobium salinum]|uniref:NAD(P)H-binding protein n=1 Tax=Halobium salinum TaxID=1364940 RepID=A0ABD5P962_9EURY|nr:NAD(P)H-binding protein [Halobium salinum]
MRVLVTGATGFVGSRLVPVLTERDHHITVLTRDADGYDGPADAVVEGDVLERGSFEAALADVDAAFYLIHSMGESGDEDFAETDRRAATNFRDAATEAGVGRVLYLSGLGDEEDEELSAHLASRREVERVLVEGSYELTVLRAAVVIGAGNTSFEVVSQLVRRFPVLVTPRWVRVDCQPIAAADVIAYLVGALESAETAGGVYDVGGPRVVTWRDLLTRTGRVGGWPTRVVPVSWLRPDHAARLAGLATELPGEVVRPLVKGLENEVVADDGDVRDLLPIPLDGYGLAIRRALVGHGIEATVDRVQAKLAEVEVSTPNTDERRRQRPLSDGE